MVVFGGVVAVMMVVAGEYRGGRLSRVVGDIS